MLTTNDIIAAKIIVQLGLARAADVRTELRKVDGDLKNRDLVNRFTAGGRLDEKTVELIRHRVALYDHVWSEAIYVRSLEKVNTISREEVAQLIAELERSATRRRVGDILVRQGKLTLLQDAKLTLKQRAAIEKESERILNRYRGEDFVGVAKPLIPDSKLEPGDFKISTLFRSRETRILVNKAELAALQGELPIVPAQETKRVPRKKKKSAPESDLERLRRMKRIADYTIVEVLGVGGMGAVFLGQQEGREGVFAAIKVMLESAASPKEKGRFLREIALTKGIKHPNVIGIIDSGTTEDGLTYLVVPALAGKELRSHLEGPLDPDFACHIFLQVLEGLQAVHDAGIVHRDMKPENVFVLAGAERAVKIMDFGLAKRANSSSEDEEDLFRTDTGEVVGSAAYIAPESVQCDAIDGRTDIYSAGVMFFEMLAGKLPIQSQTAAGFLTQHMICPPLALAEVLPDRKWPPLAEEIVAKMLGKSRDERPASCRAIIEDVKKLRAAFAAEGKTVPPAAAPEAEEPRNMSWRGLLGRLLGRSA